MNLPTLRSLPRSFRVMITGFLLVLGTGYGLAALNAALEVGISPAAISDHYGEPSLSGEEAAVMAEQGYVEEEFSLGDEGGVAHSADHSADAEHAGDMHHADDFGAEPMDAHDGETGGEAIELEDLVELSHIHLLAFSLILFCAGTLACLSSWSEGVKSVLVGALAACLLLDIGSLFLVRFVSAGMAWLTFVAGSGIGICLLLISLRVLWDLWGPESPAA
ncbi:MAG: hypothetical protein OEW11_02970 [Nitrospirota bacterium]|nr:hypothetical protein [Nitrospirota bacterium]